MALNWLEMVKKAKKSCIVHSNLKKVHYALDNGKEMVEEYNMDTGVLTRRAWKIKTDLGGDGEWDIEIGDPEPAALKPGSDIIKENASQPILSRRITKTNLEWRIRNLPYPLETYSVTAEDRWMTVRTTNKKYFKKIQIPELERVNLLPEQDRISFTHKFNTLIITYKKPEEVLKMEKIMWEEVKDLQPQQTVAPKPSDCRQS